MVIEARKQGVSDGQIDEAAENEHAKGALIDVIVASRTEAGTRVLQLQNLGISALRKRASADGVDEVCVDQALDSDSPKAALISLLTAGGETRIGHQPVVPNILDSSSRSRPHFGSSSGRDSTNSVSRIAAAEEGSGSST